MFTNGFWERKKNFPCRAMPHSCRAVARISNLLYRRIPFGRPPDYSKAHEFSEARGLEIRDTAGWKPARRAFSPGQTEALPWRLGPHVPDASECSGEFSQSATADVTRRKPASQCDPGIRLPLVLRPFALPGFRRASSLLWPLLTSPPLSTRGSPRVSVCSFRSRRWALQDVASDSWASCSLAHSPPTPCLTAHSCSCGRIFASHPFASAPCGDNLAVRLRLASQAPVGNFSSR